MTRHVACLLVFASIARPLDAQRLAELTAGVRHERRSCVVGAATCPAGTPAVPQESSRTPAWSIIASAVIPGTGQAVLQVNRAMPYLAVEAFSWTSYVRHSQQYRRHRDGYRDLAARVARAAFTSIRPNGTFEYYERMTHYAESGRYDLVAGGGIDPETDTTTYNGSVWLLARRTFWLDPQVAPDTQSAEWRRAVAFYQSRAYDQLYRWSWSNAPLEYAAFHDLISESNDANRRAMTDLGIIIANHLLSMVDAYITVRLRRDTAREEFGLEARLPLPGGSRK